MKKIKIFFQSSFSRSQISSIFSTGIDYAIVLLFVEVFQSWYVLATALGALAGAISNFFLNRHWSFQASHGQLKRQARRYGIVSGGSLLLNSFGVFLVTEHLQIHYILSVIFVSLFVGILFNYPLQRNYVYLIQK